TLQNSQKSIAIEYLFGSSGHWHSPRDVSGHGGWRGFAGPTSYCGAIEFPIRWSAEQYFSSLLTNTLMSTNLILLSGLIFSVCLAFTTICSRSVAVWVTGKQILQLAEYSRTSKAITCALYVLVCVVMILVDPYMTQGSQISDFISLFLMHSFFTYSTLFVLNKKIICVDNGVLTVTPFGHLKYFSNDQIIEAKFKHTKFNSGSTKFTFKSGVIVVNDQMLNQLQTVRLIKTKLSSS
ncbi:hypothetical protein, partial [Roseateles albus]